MAKTIIFCADGTWNGPSADAGSALDDAHEDFAAGPVTNVVKIFANMAGHVTPETAMLPNEQEKVLREAGGEAVQVMKYLHGVGDSRNPVARLLGGAFGLGVVARIVRGYTFISRHHEPGDRICILGFSRGAYTARALAGMIASVGLLNRAAYDEDDKEAAYELGMTAWAMARRKSLEARGLMTVPARALIDCVEHFAGRRMPEDGLKGDVQIEAVGVWDTVGSLGIPVYDVTRENARLDVFQFADTVLSDHVRHGFHAMALDERRQDFPVTKWTERAGVQQVWFVGAHSDVGGGYPAEESGLSNLALDWMMRKLAGVGVAFAEPLPAEARPRDPMQAIHTPWNDPPFNLLGRGRRPCTLQEQFHESVRTRWRNDPAYALPDGHRPADREWTAVRFDAEAFQPA